MNAQAFKRAQRRKQWRAFIARHTDTLKEAAAGIAVFTLCIALAYLLMLVFPN